MTPTFTMLYATSARQQPLPLAVAQATLQSLPRVTGEPALQLVPPVTVEPTLQPTEPANSSENRVAKRQRVLKAAKIILDDWRAIDCQIRDVSATGAKIRVDGAMSMPHKFQLLSIVDNTIRPCQVAWKLKDTIGVVFRGEATRAPVRKLVTGFC